MTLVPAPHLLKTNFNFRLAVICIAAASIGLSMVAVSMAKLLRVICGIGVMLNVNRPPDTTHALKGMASPSAILIALLVK